MPDLSQPAVIAASIAAIVAVVGLVANAFLNLCLSYKRGRLDLDLAKLRYTHDLGIADWKRKADFAESLVVDFGEAITRLKAIRDPGAFVDEVETREGRDQEPEEVRANRDAYYPIVSRLREESSFFEQLYAKRFRARAFLVLTVRLRLSRLDSSSSTFVSL